METRPPREGLARAHTDLHLRAETQDGPPVLFGHLIRWNEWTEINSDFEGHFMERVAPGAAKKTIAENGGRMRSLFQHGQDPQIGDKPLGAIDVLEEDRQGVYYEVPLLDAPYVRDTVLPGLRAGLYGTSFRFSVQREEFKRDTQPSDYNPKGLPERTLREIQIKEFGPVTFPAYVGATAAVRSITDDLLKRTLGVENRMDAEDLDCLAQMIALGTGYISEQDEPGDQANIPRMESVLATLVELAQYEATEDEGVEPEDEMEMASSDGRNATEAPPGTDAAHMGTSVRDAAEAAKPLTWLDILGPDETEEVSTLWNPQT